MRSLHVTGLALIAICWLTCTEGGTTRSQSQTPHRSHKLIQPTSAERGRVLGLFSKGKGWDGHALSQVGKIHVIKKPGWGASNYGSGWGWNGDSGGWGWSSKKKTLKEKLIAKLPKKSFGVQWKGGVGFSFGGKGDKKAQAGYDQANGWGWGTQDHGHGWGQNLGWSQNYGWGQHHGHGHGHHGHGHHGHGHGWPVQVHHHHHGDSHEGWGWDGDYDDDAEDDDQDQDDDDEYKRLRELKKKNKRRNKNKTRYDDDDVEEEVKEDVEYVEADEEVVDDLDIDEEEEKEKRRQTENKKRRKNDEYAATTSGGDDYANVEDDADARELIENIDALGTEYGYANADDEADDVSLVSRSLLSDIYHVQDDGQGSEGSYFDYEPVVPQFYNVDRYGDY